MRESLISNKYEKEKKKKKIKDEKSSLTVVSVHSIERWIIRLRLSFDYQSWCVPKFEWNLDSLCIVNKASKRVLWRCSLHTKQDQNMRMNKDEREFIQSNDWLFQTQTKNTLDMNMVFGEVIGPKMLSKCSRLSRWISGWENSNLEGNGVVRFFPFDGGNG